jgi:hypothetical protein
MRLVGHSALANIIALAVLATTILSIGYAMRAGNYAFWGTRLVIGGWVIVTLMMLAVMWIVLEFARGHFGSKKGAATARADRGDAANSGDVSSQNQTGGVTAGVAHIYNAPTARAPAAPRSLGEVLSVEFDQRHVYNGGYPNRQGGVVGLRIANDGMEDVLSVGARIENLVWASRPLGTWMPVNFFHPGVLRWSMRDGGGSEADIGAGENRICEVVAYEGSDALLARLIFAHEPTEPVIWFGRWRALVKIFARGWQPFDYELEFEWKSFDNGTRWLDIDTN